jgi:hypothetical protein
MSGMVEGMSTYGNGQQLDYSVAKAVSGSAVNDLFHIVFQSRA